LNQSFHIGSVRGITIRVHAMSLWLLGGLLLYVLAKNDDELTKLFFLGIPAVLVLVFLHELGHSVVAQHFGIKVVDITFWPLGGMARMSEIPEDSRIEGLIAIAGPAVNFALALLALAVWGVAGAPVSGVLAVFTYVFVLVNLMLGGFNLLPAFPMDGGRVLRAWLGRKGDWVGATEKAVRVSRVMAILLVFPGILLSCAMPLVAVFVWLVGARELMAVRLRHGISPFGGFAQQGEPFAGARYEPSADSGSGAARGSGGGFTDADIAELESYRGRLKRPGDD